MYIVVHVTTELVLPCVCVTLDGIFDNWIY
jgi:hypothetical protein